MGIRFEGRRHAMFAESGAGDRADAARHASFRPIETQCEKVVHGGAGGEGDQIRALLGEAGFRTGGIFGFGDGAVGDAFIDDGTEFGEAVINDIPGLRGFYPEHGQVFDGLLFEGIDQALGHEFLRDQIHGETIFADFLRRAFADYCDARIAEAAGVRVGGEEGIEESINSVRAGENKPVVFVGVGDEFGERLPVLRVFDADGGQLDHIRAEIARAPC